MAVDYTRYRNIEVEKRDRIVIFTLNRPEVLNAVNEEMHADLEEIFSDVTKDDDVNVIILTGKGKAFCAGGDVKAMKAEEFQQPSVWVSRSGRRLILNLLEVEQPIIAAINGDAVGLGATLALFCDIIIAAENAMIGDPHIKVGLVAGDGGAVIWPLLVGVAKAKELLLTGDLISAKEAERIGLINKVVPPEKLYPTVMALAQRLASGPTRAIRWTKHSINKLLREKVNLILDTSLALETISMGTDDHKEAVTAFTEKRKPQFKGR